MLPLTPVTDKFVEPSGIEPEYLVLQTSAIEPSLPEFRNLKQEAGIAPATFTVSESDQTRYLHTWYNRWLNNYRFNN